MVFFTLQLFAEDLRNTTSWKIWDLVPGIEENFLKEQSKDQIWMSWYVEILLRILKGKKH